MDVKVFRGLTAACRVALSPTRRESCTRHLELQTFLRLSKDPNRECSSHHAVSPPKLRHKMVLWSRLVREQSLHCRP